MILKNCYFPKDYDFTTTEYGYDIYEKKIKDILEQNEYQSKRIYIHMIVCAPNSCKKEELFEVMEWNEDTYSYEWVNDWCEGQTDVCIMGIYTDDFINNMFSRYSHKGRYSGGWFTV